MASSPDHPGAEDALSVQSGGSEAPPAPRPSSAEPLSARIQRASLLSLVSYFGSQLLRLGGNVVLTRLLFEEAFGLMALVGVVLQGLYLFSDIGIGQSLVQSKRGEEPAFQNTVFTIQVVRGLVLWLLACAAAWPIAILYERRELLALLPAAGFTAFIAGFNSTNLFTLNRHLSMGRLAILEITTQVVTLTCMILWAWYDRSVWALVCGALVMNATYVLLSHAILPGTRNRFHWDKTAADELFGFGRWIFLSTALSFLASQSDRLIFGKLVSMRALGVYNIAFSVAQMPSAALSHLSSTVVFPVYSRIFESGEDVDRAFHAVRYPLLLLGGYLCAGVIAGGPVIIDMLYDARFHDGGWMLQLLAIGSWFAFLEYSIMCALLAAGKTRWIAIGAAGRLTAIAVLIPLGYHLGGFPGALLGFAGADVVRLCVSIAAARRLGVRSFYQDVWMTALVAVATVLAMFACAQVAPYAASGLLGSLTKAATVALAVSVLWLPFALRYLASRRQRQAGDH